MPYYDVRLSESIPKDQNGKYLYDIFDDKYESTDSFNHEQVPIDYDKLSKYI